LKHLKLKRVVIDEPYENMPAAEVGLKKGDIILSIDDTVCTDKTNEFVSSHLRGEAGTTFILKILRPSTNKKMQFKIQRKAIQMPAVPYYGLQKDSIGYININQFTDDCSKDVRRAFIEMKKQGMKGLILDLRGNGGGSVTEAVSVVNMFVPKDLTILNTKGKLKNSNISYKTTVEPIDTVMPIVVMVNDGTASSSEITCGSLQDLDRAVILGTRTYGKGITQRPNVELPYNGNLKLTVSKYYIPSGRCIQAINYKHDNGGYKEHIPDSLTHVFHTANGREVRDGGGIKPDIEVTPDSLPNIAFYLASSGRDSTESMLNYEINYIAKHSTIAKPSEFEISDAEYADFKQQVLQNGFTYDRESSKYLSDLKKLAKFEGYYDNAKNEFENLEKKLSHNISKDLDYNKEILKQILASDIVAAYYYQRGSIENGLRSDKQMKEAVRLIKTPKEYHKLLSPPTKKDKK
jgi:carboxyl-terminal processing protease